MQRFLNLTLSTGLTLILAGLSVQAKGNYDSRDKFNQMDANNDGRISPAEHEMGAARMFTEMDSNSDTMVTSSEMQAYHRQKKNGKGMGKNEMSFADKIAEIDTNNDGIISQREHVDGAKAKFSQMDTDRNGFVTIDEMTSAHRKMKMNR